MLLPTNKEYNRVETALETPKLKLYEDNADRIRSPIVGGNSCKSRKLSII